MKYIYKGIKDFNLDHIFDCGQCFRWTKQEDGSYTGIAFGRVVNMQVAGDNKDELVIDGCCEEDFNNIWWPYLDMGRDYGAVKVTLAEDDDIMARAVESGTGIRILKQDLWETIISFIISQSNNIPRIKGIIEKLCTNFGEEIRYMGKTYYSFPSPETISALTLEELSVIRAGFRDKYILGFAKAVASNEFDMYALKSMTTSDAKASLMSVKGIGNKVSDCILLFGLGRADSFPVDVWIKRIMEYCYFEGEESIKTISSFAEEKFGQLGGYAQQYLFFYARENKIGV